MIEIPTEQTNNKLDVITEEIEGRSPSSKSPSSSDYYSTRETDDLTTCDVTTKSYDVTKTDDVSTRRSDVTSTRSEQTTWDDERVKEALGKSAALRDRVRATRRRGDPPVVVRSHSPLLTSPPPSATPEMSSPEPPAVPPRPEGYQLQNEKSRVPDGYQLQKETEKARERVLDGGRRSPQRRVGREDRRDGFREGESERRGDNSREERRGDNSREERRRENSREERIRDFSEPERSNHRRPSQWEDRRPDRPIVEPRRSDTRRIEDGRGTEQSDSRRVGRGDPRRDEYERRRSPDTSDRYNDPRRSDRHHNDPRRSDRQPNPPRPQDLRFRTDSDSKNRYENGRNPPRSRLLSPIIEHRSAESPPSSEHKSSPEGRSEEGRPMRFEPSDGRRWSDIGPKSCPEGRSEEGRPMRSEPSDGRRWSDIGQNGRPLNPESRGVSPGPRDRALSPGPRDRALSPGPRDRALSPGLRDRALSPGPRDRALSPGPRDRDPGPGPRDRALSPGPRDRLGPNYRPMDSDHRDGRPEPRDQHDRRTGSSRDHWPRYQNDRDPGFLRERSRSSNPPRRDNVDTLSRSRTMDTQYSRESMSPADSRSFDPFPPRIPAPNSYLFDPKEFDISRYSLGFLHAQRAFDPWFTGPRFDPRPSSPPALPARGSSIRSRRILPWEKALPSNHFFSSIRSTRSHDPSAHRRRDDNRGQYVPRSQRRNKEDQDVSPARSRSRAGDGNGGQFVPRSQRRKKEDREVSPARSRAASETPEKKKALLSAFSKRSSTLPSNRRVKFSGNREERVFSKTDQNEGAHSSYAKFKQFIFSNL